MKLTKVERISALQLVIERVSGTRMTAEKLPIVMAIELGSFLIEAKYLDVLYVADGTGAVDEFSIDFFKPLTDNAAFAEHAYREFRKVLADNGYVTDSDYIDFFKNLNDPVGATEAHAFDVWKPRADAFSVGDDGAKLHPNKITFDGLSTQDDNTIIFGKPLTDGSDVSEFYEASFLKSRSDAFGVTDTDAWLLEKPFEDEVISPDDYVVLFTKKAPDDPLTLTEKVEKSFSRGFSEAYSVGEAHSLEPGKVLFDQVTGIGDYVFLFTKKAPDNPVGTTDEINTLGVGKNLADTGSLSDQINTIAFAKPLTEAPAATDEINTKATTKALANSVGVTDDVDGAASILDDQEMQFVKNTTEVVGMTDVFIIYKTFFRDFTETAALSDALAQAFGKALTDSFTMSDGIISVVTKSLSDVGVITENAVNSVDKISADVLTVSQKLVLSPNKVATDTASFTDAGSLRSQNYSDFAYFGEDFVGASKTF